MAEFEVFTELPRVTVLNDRMASIIERARGRRVLHLGCVDSGLLAERFARGELMHQALAGVAAELWGVDIDAAGIGFLRERGFGQLLVGDICAVDQIEALRGREFDLIIASEVVEHLPNPGAFLVSVQALMAPETELVITVPNAYGIDSLLAMLRGKELVHPDHNYWFSYRTITNLVTKSGLAVRQLFVYSYQYHTVIPRALRGVRASGAAGGGMPARRPATRPLPARIAHYLRVFPKRVLVSALYARTPFWGDGIIVVAGRQPPGRDDG